MGNKKEGNENIIILGDFNYTMDKMERDDGIKTQRLYNWNTIMSCENRIVDNGLDDLWRRENPHSSS